MNFSNLNLTLSECAQAIQAFGTTNTFLLTAEPGVGKSSVLTMLEKSMGDGYDYIYVDCPTFDTPDVGMALPDHEAQTLKFFVNNLFKLTGKDAKRPKVIMLDELAKCRGPLLLVFTRLILERVLAGIPLPEGSKVFATSNNSSDGVGDNFASHFVNRLTKLRVAKSAFDEWQVWAVDAGIDADVITWAGENANVFDSYTDGTNESDWTKQQKEVRPFIFNPSTPGQPFVSPRSLAKCSEFVKHRHTMRKDMFIALLAGTVGEGAARSMSGFFDTLGKLVPFAAIVADPMGVPVDRSGATPMIQVNNAVARINTPHEFSQFLLFLDRMNHGDLKMLFMRKIMLTEKGRAAAGTHRAALEWMADPDNAAMI
jgi:hypothetical protein